MPIEVVASKSGRSRAVLSLPIEPTRSSPSQCPTENASHELNGVEASAERRGLAIEPGLGSDVVDQPSPRSLPPPPVERTIPSDTDQRQPVPPPRKPESHQSDPTRIEWTSLRTEVNTMEQNQKRIAHVLRDIRGQMDHSRSQATAFQQMHDRHNNSVNAILTFLAVFHRKEI